MISVNTNKQFGEHDLKGLSTDPKPTQNVRANSLFLELDTGDFYFFNGVTWEKLVISGGEANTAWGNITGTMTNQTDLASALASKADIASPTFTGTPAAPTAASGTNTTQIATTAFVTEAISNIDPSNSFVCSNYIGNGNSSRTISLTFEPKFVIVFCCSMPFTTYDSENEYTEVNSAFLASFNSEQYSSPGGYISGNGFIVYQMADGQDQQGMHYSLNLTGESYAYIAFK